MLKLTMEEGFFFPFSSIGDKFKQEKKNDLVQGVASLDIKLGTNKKIMGRRLLCYFLSNKMMHSEVIPSDEK